MKNIYLDYSATTMPDKEVIKHFTKVAKNYYANPNSNHDIGLKSNKIIKESINNICKYFNIEDDEIIFTSGASESNNTVLKGVVNGTKNEIITTKLEHSSIYGPIGYLQSKGYSIKFVPTDEFGIVKTEELESMINENTLLVSIGAVNSELGIRQPIEKLAKVVKKHNGVLFHTDITQALGKDKIDLTNVDLASFSGHKLYGFKGIGGLIKKKNVKLIPLIHGGKSTTVYRSGTPQTELIASLSKSFDLFKDSLDEKYKYVEYLNKYLKKQLQKYNKIKINSTKYSIPHILNISIIGQKSKTIQKYFSNKHIYISTQTACANNTEYSKTVHELTNDMNLATSSIRISLSYKTTKEELDKFLEVLREFMEEYYESNKN